MRPTYDRYQINPDYKYVSHAVFEMYKQLCRPTAKPSPTTLPLAPPPRAAMGAWLGLRREQRTPRKSRGEERKPTKAEVGIRVGAEHPVTRRGFTQQAGGVVVGGGTSMRVRACVQAQRAAHVQAGACTHLIPFQ